MTPCRERGRRWSERSLRAGLPGSKIASARISGTKREQDLAGAMRFQRLFERFLELVERVHVLHCGGERSIRYEVAQLLVNLRDLCAGRIAYPIDEPESMEAKTTVDELFGRDGRELPTLKAVNDNRAARFK